MAEEQKKVGRPLKYETPELMQTAIDEYFVNIHNEQRPPTICGLTLALGFVERHALLNYEGYGEGFYATIKRAKTRVEMYHEERLSKGNPAGHIFALKNFNWSDKQIIKQEGGFVIEPSPELIALGKQLAEQYAKETK